MRNAAFAHELGRALHRPAVLRLPAAPLRLIGGDMAEELLLTGRRVVPEKALKSGFVFRYPQLRGALAAMLGTSAPQARQARRLKAIPPCGMPGCDERPILPLPPQALTLSGRSFHMPQ